MQKRVDPIKQQYKKINEFGLVLTLLMLTVVFMASKRVDRSVIFEGPDIAPVEVIEVPVTVQENRAKRPELPTVPIESEDTDVPEDATIEFSDINWDLAELPAPPPPKEEEKGIEFVAYDKLPEIIGGYAELAKHLVYPEIARKSGVEGKVVVQVQLSDQGKVLGTQVLKSLGNNGCDEAAIDAIKKVKWIPAYQRDTPVNVIISVTVIFRLN